MLITTLPSPHKLELIKEIFSHPAIGGARFNLGTRTLYGPKQTLQILLREAERHGKALWVDLKGRQLRITKWADPTYGDIVLNNEIEVDLPAKVVFRGGHWSNVIAVDGARIVVDPDPEYALGEGQAVNIIGRNFTVKGTYLTAQDEEYIEAAKELGIHRYMLSFVEKEEDITEVRHLDPEAEPVLKIESVKGLAYAARQHTGGRLIAARDDLLINIGPNKTRMLQALELIIEKDATAIAASHLFSSLEHQDFPSQADISDLRLLHLMGYKNFMLSDNVSHKCFGKAMRAWQQFFEIYHE